MLKNKALLGVTEDETEQRQLFTTTTGNVEVSVPKYANKNDKNLLKKTLNWQP